MQLLTCLLSLLAAASAGWGQGLTGGYETPIKPGIVGYGYAGPYRGYGGLGYGGHPEYDPASSLKVALPTNYQQYSYTASLRPGLGIVNGQTARIANPFRPVIQYRIPAVAKPTLPAPYGSRIGIAYTSIWN